MKYNDKVKIIIPIFILLLFVLYGCTKDFPLDKDLTKKNYILFSQDSVEVNFPAIIKGNIAVIGFIYTHCPDICPMTTHNMYLTEERLKEEGINDVKFVALSFDPGRDKPSVLKKFASIRNISFKYWVLLTGDELIISDLLRRFDVKAIKADSTYDNDGTLSYSVLHTDRISLIDKNGTLKKNYKGSTVNIDELINDIKILGE
ncbi:MAG: SCO family protein [Nitrososphaeraceae archaeon]|nr:SCO family protein [Nitrososphaeraceae archaeon]